MRLRGHMHCVNQLVLQQMLLLNVPSVAAGVVWQMACTLHRGAARALLHHLPSLCPRLTDCDVAATAAVTHHRDEVSNAVGSRQFTFSLLVHSDAGSPMVDWSQNSSILQVCRSCQHCVT